MKRLALTASLALVVVVPGTAQALTRTQTLQYEHAYFLVRHALGSRAPGCKLIGASATCHGAVSDARVLASTGVLERMLAPPPAPVPVARPAPATAPADSTTPPPVPDPAPASAPVASSGASGGYSDVPGVPSGFASCVAQRESTDGAGSSNIYGIEGPGGQGSLAEQKAAFASMYAQQGSQPWSPYDGC